MRRVHPFHQPDQLRGGVLRVCVQPGHRHPQRQGKTTGQIGDPPHHVCRAAAGAQQGAQQGDRVFLRQRVHRNGPQPVPDQEVGQPVTAGHHRRAPRGTREQGTHLVGGGGVVENEQHPAARHQGAHPGGGLVGFGETAIRFRGVGVSGVQVAGAEVPGVRVADVQVRGVGRSRGQGADEAAKDVSMHIAAMRPVSLKAEQLPASEVETERAILRETALKEGKPANIVDKMVEGRLKNYYAEQVLVEQPFVKDNTITVGKFAQQSGIKIVRFAHWILGS